MTRRIPDIVYLSTDRQWAKNPTPICTEAYYRINRRDPSVDLVDDLEVASSKGLGITLNPLDVKELLHKPEAIETQHGWRDIHGKIHWMEIGTPRASVIFEGEARVSRKLYPGQPKEEP